MTFLQLIQDIVLGQCEAVVGTHEDNADASHPAPTSKVENYWDTVYLNA